MPTYSEMMTSLAWTAFYAGRDFLWMTCTGDNIDEWPVEMRVYLRWAARAAG